MVLFLLPSLRQYRCLIFKSTKHYQTSHEDCAANYSPNSKRFFSHNLFHYLLQGIDILLREKILLLQMTCFLNMKNNIRTVCPHNVFWTKAIQDEDKLLRRTNCLRQLHYHRSKQGYQWGERAQQLKPGSRLHTGQHQVCKAASTYGEREEVPISFYLEAWPRLSSSMVLFGFPVNWFHNASCLLPAALLSSLLVAVLENVLEWF